MKKLSKLQQKLWDSGQLKPNPIPRQEDNSVMIDKMKNQSNINLMKLKKNDLLAIAEGMGCKVTPKNTKKQIIEAIEKQSA